MLSSSGSDRWMKCTPSARLEAKEKESTSVYAEEGTLAHEIGELKIKKQLGTLTTRSFNAKMKKLRQHELYQDEMEEYTDAYADYVIMVSNEAAKVTPDSMVAVESKLDFSDWVQEGFGTGDAVIIADGTLEVMDLKYGKGVPVSAENNSQMMLYGLGAYHEFSPLYDIQNIRVHVVQPRLDNISVWEISKEDLLDWANNTVKPRAELAWKGEGEFCAGDHCRFCRVKATCRERAEANLKMAQLEFKAGPLLTDEEIPEVIRKADELAKWAEDVKKYAFEEAKNGKKWEGFKLVRGRSNRIFTDTNNVVKVLEKEGYNEDQIFTKKVNGIGAIEKLVGKKNFPDLLGNFVHKPEGKPTLVPESDKREAIDLQEFKVEE